MSNIWGFQGVHTPLESVTNGRYSLAQYTAMRTELTARIEALNNQAGFIPTNINAVGYITIAPGSGSTGGGDGYLTASGSITTAKDLTVMGGAQIYGSAGGFGLSVVNDIQCGGEVQGQGGLLTPASVTCNSVIFPGGTQSVPYVLNATVMYLSVNQTLNQTYYPPASSCLFTTVTLNYSNACTVNLLNMGITNVGTFPNYTRSITIIKAAMTAVDYSVTITPPTSYRFYSPSGTDQTSYILPVGKFTVSFQIYGSPGQQRIFLTSLV